MAARNGMILKPAETLGKGNMIGALDVLIAQEEHLVPEQFGLDGPEQVVVARRFGKVHAFEFRADMAGELFDFHITNTDEPVVLPASRSR